MAILLHEIPHEVSAQIVVLESGVTSFLPMFNMGMQLVQGFGVGLAH